MYDFFFVIYFSIGFVFCDIFFYMISILGNLVSYGLLFLTELQLPHERSTHAAKHNIMMKQHNYGLVIFQRLRWSDKNCPCCAGHQPRPYNCLGTCPTFFIAYWSVIMHLSKNRVTSDSLPSFLSFQILNF